MEIFSWNVNGLRAGVRKGFLDYFTATDADIFCLQEIKLQAGQIELDIPDYYQYWNYAERKGYSGTAIFSKEKALTIQYGIGHETDSEGRVITLEFDNFYLVNAYTPNSQRSLARLDIRLTWEDKMYEHLHKLEESKPVILCGDLNVAHQEIDLKNSKANQGNSGFTIEEREKMTRLLESGFVDSLRHFYPDNEGIFTWWSYMKTVRERNIGWRIDYFIVSKGIANLMEDSKVHSKILGSDHCPISLKLNLGLHSAQ